MLNQLKKPWQGKVLGIIYVLLSLILPIITGFIIYIYIEAYIISQNIKVAAKMLSLFPFLYGISFIAMFVIVLLAVGIFTGKRWVLVVVLILSILNSIMGVINIFKKILGDSMLSTLVLSIVGSFIALFSIYLSFKCLQHPYYGGDGRKFEWGSLKSWEGWKRLFLGEKAGVRGEDMTTF